MNLSGHPRLARCMIVFQIVKARGRRLGRCRIRQIRARKVWRQQRREGILVARRGSERLTRRDGLCDVVRGRKKRTSFLVDAADRPLERGASSAGPRRPWPSGSVPMRGFVRRN